MRWIARFIAPHWITGRTAGNRLEPIWRKLTHAALRGIAEKALFHVKERTPGSGRLRDQWTISELPYGWRVHNVADAEGQKILWFLEFGTRQDYDIPKGGPKPGVVLRWLDPDTGKWAFAKHVVHPGIMAYEMVGGAVRELQRDPKVQETMRELARMLVESLEG